MLRAPPRSMFTACAISGKKCIFYIIRRYFTYPPCKFHLLWYNDISGKI